jgi:hypothetical protein
VVGQPGVGVVIAFVDESVRTGSGGLLYVVAAGVVVKTDADRARDELRKFLSPRQGYFHWGDEKPARRLAMLDRLAELDVMAFVTSYYPAANRRQERARASCLTMLVGDLRVEDVDELVVETRGEYLDRRDRRTLLHVREVGIAADSLTYRHAGKLEEPGLWAADAIAGAVATHLAGNDSQYYERLRPSLLKIRQHGL